MAEDDHHLRNLKFLPKGEEDKVFGMQIPKELITDNIRNAPYYNAYLEMVAKHDHKIVAEKGGKKKSASKAEPSKKPATAKQPKLGKGIATNEQVALSLLDLHKPKKKSTMNQFLLQRCTPVTKEASTGPSAQPEDDASTNIVCDTQEDAANKVDLHEKTVEIDEGQAGPDPGKTPESRPPPERFLMEEDQAGPNPGQSHAALAGPDPMPMHDDFVATMCPQVHESLKHPDEEHVHMENPLSLTGTLSYMKNLDNFNFVDQFIADKSPEDEPRNANMETKVKSMVTVPIHQD
nr:histone deacetylase 14 [Tanacetum cinerariifolium]